ncbi:S24 family peptidase [Corticibacter populi]|uniref:S24 family peptidase n=1 Tax=Corticibacter populi TaxID=1550736 RepID=UPI0013EE91F3|nr:LexA family transcriptional regulator [Corticibacter populi]
MTSIKNSGTQAFTAEHTIDDADENFIARLRLLADKMGSVNSLAKSAGVSQSGFQRYLAGGQPTRKVLIALAQAAQVSLEWLMTGQGDPQPEAPTQALELDLDESIRSLTRLPLYADRKPVADNAGDNAIPMSPKNVAGLGFCRFWLGQHGMSADSVAGLYMAGNSMAPTILHGDTVLVNITERNIIDGDIYALRSQNTLLIKRIQNELDGRLRLMSDNPIFKAIEVHRDTADVIGRVVWRGSLF